MWTYLKWWVEQLDVCCVSCLCYLRNWVTLLSFMVTVYLSYIVSIEALLLCWLLLNDILNTLMIVLSRALCIWVLTQLNNVDSIKCLDHSFVLINLEGWFVKHERICFILLLRLILAPHSASFKLYLWYFFSWFCNVFGQMMGKVNQERLAEYLGELKQKQDTNDRYVAALRGETLTRKPYQRIQPVPKPNDTVTTKPQ